MKTQKPIEKLSDDAHYAVSSTSMLVNKVNELVEAFNTGVGDNSETHVISDSEIRKILDKIGYLNDSLSPMGKSHIQMIKLFLIEYFNQHEISYYVKTNQKS